MNLSERVHANDKVITVSDARAYFKSCIPGWQAFSEQHDFHWPTVVRHGLLASQLLACNDAMATSLVEYVYNKDTINE